jgi:hypothetical protein
MDATTPDRERHIPHSTDEELLSTLRTMGPQTIEKLASLPGLSWAQVFLAIDRLSRSGEVSLQPIRRCEYQVSLEQSLNKAAA